MTQPGLRLPCGSRGFAKETSGCLTSHSPKEKQEKKKTFDRTITTQSSFLHNSSQLVSTQSVGLYY